MDPIGSILVLLQLPIASILLWKRESYILGGTSCGVSDGSEGNLLLPVHQFTHSPPPPPISEYCGLPGVCSMGQGSQDKTPNYRDKYFTESLFSDYHLPTLLEPTSPTITFSLS